MESFSTCTVQLIHIRAQLRCPHHEIHHSVIQIPVNKLNLRIEDSITNHVCINYIGEKPMGAVSAFTTGNYHCQLLIYSKTQPMKTQHNSAIQCTEKYITENALDAGTNVHTKQTYCREQRHIIHQTKCTSGAEAPCKSPALQPQEKASTQAEKTGGQTSE